MQGVIASVLAVSLAIDVTVVDYGVYTTGNQDSALETKDKPGNQDWKPRFEPLGNQDNLVVH